MRATVTKDGFIFIEPETESERHFIMYMTQKTAADNMPPMIIISSVIPETEARGA